MPRHPEPWFRDGRGWYVQLDGRQVFLGEHPPGFPRPQKSDGRWNPPQPIRDALHRRMAGRGTAPNATVILDSAPVVAVLDAYLDWLLNRVREGSKAQRTFDWYRKYLDDFAHFATDSYRVQDLTVAQLEPIHVYQWVDSHAGWKTGKRGAITAVQRAFGWAATAGLLKSLGSASPLRALEKPQQGRREQLVSEAEYREVLSLVRDQEFRDLLAAGAFRPRFPQSTPSRHAGIVRGDLPSRERPDHRV
jgi:hypothetical protein